MQTLNRMAIWTIKKRIGNLTEFSNLLVRYYNNLEYDNLGIQRYPNREGEAVRSLINMQLADIRTALAAVSCDNVITVYDPPALGGRGRTFELFGNLFTEAVYDYPRTPIDAVETAIGKYKEETVAAWVRTVNPLHWLNEFLLYIITAPLRFLASVGIPKKFTEFSWIARLYVGFFQVASWAVIAISMLQAFGYWETVRAWVEHIIH